MHKKPFNLKYIYKILVTPIWKDPVPGWTDNLNGPVGLMLGAGKGVIRTMYCSPNTYLDYISVDAVANGMITAPFFFKRTK